MKRRVIIFVKGSLLGCIGLADDGAEAAVLTYDSRCGVKAARALLPSGAAAAFVEGEITKSESRGWRPVYDGAPNNG